jgi:hypothetical protein
MPLNISHRSKEYELEKSDKVGMMEIHQSHYCQAASAVRQDGLWKRYGKLDAKGSSVARVNLDRSSQKSSRL